MHNQIQTQKYKNVVNRKKEATVETTLTTADGPSSTNLTHKIKIKIIHRRFIQNLLFSRFSVELILSNV